MSLDMPTEVNETAVAATSPGHNDSYTACVFVTPAAMKAIQVRPTSPSGTVQGHSPLKGNLPEKVYDCLYEGRERKPVQLTEVKPFVNQLQSQIEKYKKEYKPESELLFATVIDEMETADTAIQCSKFPQVYHSLQKIKRSSFQSNIQDQYQVLEFLRPINAGVEKSGLLPENISKNRDIDSVPIDRFRPVLVTPVEDVEQKHDYILTEAPMKHTIVDMWRLMNDCNSSTIVMLNQIQKKDDDAVYWPRDVGQLLRIGTITAENMGYNLLKNNPNISFRNLQLTVKEDQNRNYQKQIKQFCLEKWNQQSIIRHFITLVKFVQKRQSELPPQSRSIVIHGKNGSERSGLFCAALYIAQQIELKQEVNIFSAVKHIRLYRPQCISSVKQYIFLHEFVMEYIKTTACEAGKGGGPILI